MEQEVKIPVKTQEALVSTIGEVTVLTLGPTFEKMEGVARGHRK